MTGTGVSRYLGEAEALHAGVELAAAQAEQLGRFGLVLAGLFEGALDERALHRLEVHAVGGKVPDDRLGSRWGRSGRGGRAPRRLGVPGQMLGIEQAPFAQNQRALHGVAELADVPRPRIRQELLPRLARDARRRPPG